MNINELLSIAEAKEAAKHTIIIDGVEVGSLNDEQTLQLIQIVKSLETNGTIKLNNSASATCPKKESTKKYEVKTSKTISYKIVKGEKGYIITPCMTDGTFMKAWLYKLGMKELEKQAGIIQIPVKTAKGKDGIAYGFKTKIQCENRLKTLKTEFSVEECNAALNTMYSNKEAKKVRTLQ